MKPKIAPALVIFTVALAGCGLATSPVTSSTAPSVIIVSPRPSPANPDACSGGARCVVAEGTKLELVTIERGWKPSATSRPSPEPSPGSGFVRIVVRFSVISGRQNILAGGALSLNLANNAGFGQPFGQGGGLDIPLAPECAHPEVVTLSAGDPPVELASCWQIPLPIDQEIVIQWTSNHGQTVDVPQ